jgi:hemolysin activation/secretion protein
VSNTTLMSIIDHSLQCKRIVLISSLATAMACAGIASAQSAPDAGALQRQIEQEQRKALPQKAAPQLELPAPMQALGTTSVIVKEFHFAGNTLLTSARLTRATAEFVNRPLDFAGLQNAARAVAVVYRNAGWVVRVYLPQQDITNGVVTLQVVEAKFGSVAVEGKPEHISAERLQNIVAGSQARGASVNAKALDRALLLIDDLPGVSATGHLSEGNNSQETDLVLTMTDAPLVTSNAYLDNAGSRFTGAARGILNSSLNSPFHFGDRVDVQLLYSQGADYMRAAYSVPVASHGLRVGANASHFSYKIVAPEFSALDAHGDSTAFGVDASYPLLRARLKNLYFALGADQKQFNNKSAALTTTDYKVQTANVGFSGNLFDNVAGGGATNASITYITGRVDLTGSPNEAIDALTTNTAGSFQKLQFMLARQQRVTERVSLYTSLSGQHASKNLDSSEKFYVGGASAVRAYPANEGGGSEGLLINVEGRARLPANFNLTGFFDWGSIKVNKDNDIIGAAVPNSYVLKGVGVALDWRASFGLSLKATVAHRLGSNPNPTSTGTDQDGSLIKNRVWVQASLPF